MARQAVNDVTDGLETKSAKIRALGDAGYNRAARSKLSVNPSPSKPLPACRKRSPGSNCLGLVSGFWANGRGMAKARSSLARLLLPIRACTHSLSTK
jgi:hypothetical protein